MSELLEVACDEAGHTGPDLLQKDQRMFAFGSVAISDAEAFEIIQKARTENPVQMPELKASKLLVTERGKKLIGTLLTAIEGRYVVSINDKLLALCGWFFEYIYEPVFQDNPRLLYEKNFHRFIAMYTYLWMTDPSSDAERAIEQFQKYMRSRDPKDAPFLFDNPRPPLSDNGTEHPFESVLRFAYGYRDIITADNAKLNTLLPDAGRWTLDLSASGLWSHLNHWGRTGKLLSVRCDASKPLQAIASKFTGDDNDPAIRQARMKHNPEPLGWKLLEPIVAGTTATLFANGLPGCDVIVESISRHGHPHSILPDTEVIDPTTRAAAVNALMVYDLAKRADRHGNPYENLEAMYRLAEVSWVKGDFDAFKRGFKPTD
jgi:hypothetical protein